MKILCHKDTTKQLPDDCLGGHEVILEGNYGYEITCPECDTCFNLSVEEE